MSRSGRLASGVVVAALCATQVCGAPPPVAPPIAITDDRGHTTTFAHPPVRIVTLLPSLTETVCALDACARLVGTDRYSNWPASVVALPKLGGMEDAALEQIAALHPDVVLAATSSRAIDRLEELGIPVVSLGSKTFVDSHRVFNVVARLIGTPGAGDTAWRRLDEQIAVAAARIPAGFHGQKVYVEIAEAPYAASASSFIGELLARLGLGNAVPGSLGPFPKLNPEFIVRAQPDLIVASARVLAGMPSRPGWDSLVALKEHHSCGFPPGEFEILIRPGPRLGTAAELIADCLVALDGGHPP